MWIGTLPKKPRLNFIVSVVFSHDSQTLFTGDYAGNVLAWDLSQRKHRRIMQSRAEEGGRHIHDIFPTPDGKHLLVHDRTGLVDAFATKKGLVIDPEGQAQFRYCQLLPRSREMLGLGYMYRLSLESRYGSSGKTLRSSRQTAGSRQYATFRGWNDVTDLAEGRA